MPAPCNDVRTPRAGSSMKFVESREADFVGAGGLRPDFNGEQTGRTAAHWPRVRWRGAGCRDAENRVRGFAAVCQLNPGPQPSSMEPYSHEQSGRY